MTTDNIIVEIPPNKAVNPVIGKPQYDTIQEVMEKMAENLVVVPSTLGGVNTAYPDFYYWMQIIIETQGVNLTTHHSHLPYHISQD